MDASISLRWRPREAILPALRYLQQPISLFKTYARLDWRADLISGLTVGVVLLPQAIAFSLLAGLPPVMGLYTAIVGGIVGALWGSSDQLHTGPTNTLSLLILSTLAITMVPGSPEYLAAAGLLALMSGVLQLALGLVRLGFIINFVSHSVIVGFATAAGVLIAVRQINPLLGLPSSRVDVLTGLANTVTELPSIDPLTTAIGIGTIVLIVLLRRIDPRLPGSLIALLVSTLVVYLLGDRAEDVAVIGTLTGGFPTLVRLPVFDLSLIAELSTGALAVAAIGLVQTTAVSRSIASQTRQRLDNNQEFVGQGLANMFSGLFGGYATSGSFTITAVKYRSGARTRVASIVASVVVLVAMLVSGPIGNYLPVSSLAGALIVTAYNMIDRVEIRRILQGARGDAIIMVITFLGTLFLDLDFAVLTGILTSLVLYLMRTSAPRVQFVLPDENYRHFITRPGSDPCPQLGIIEVMGDLYFGAVNHVEEEVLKLATRFPGQRYLIIRMHHVNEIDFSGIHMLENLIEIYRERGGDIFLVRAGPNVIRLMESTGSIDYLGVANLLEEDKAIDFLFHQVLDPAICIYECPVRVFRECQNLPKRFDLMGLTGSSDGFALPDGRPGVVSNDFPTISVAELRTVLRSGDATLLPIILDVREPREYRHSHIPEAQLLPLSTLLNEGFVVAMDRPLVLVCRSGRRSRRAAGVLAGLGYTDIRILAGGMQAWEAAGLLTAVEFDFT